jgi:hypothetical protein
MESNSKEGEEMKASKLISELVKQIIKNGDSDCYARNIEGELVKITEISQNYVDERGMQFKVIVMEEE